ncbi:hypothetical protein GCM10010435_48460 [Winogradskya consettensis]|uniref:Uncharacterized protein n=1 Tax=Winogradskya consettensis TaxID=113560 RepID=A0A919SLU2_9ACTN|nr:hypothetical protein [Actinoplanes consettensis]GIM73053.1 hypothetical protein Aco04nite_33390 [Actinoplanes consettensis]
MGYTGRILVARTGKPFEGANLLHEIDLGNGWRWAQLDGDARGALAALVEESGRPALSAYVMDSDVADVEALSPSGSGWHTYLHPDTAAEFGAPELEESADEVLMQALAWAAEAGLIPDPEAIRALLTAHNTFAEETLRELVAALGINPG